MSRAKRGNDPSEMISPGITLQRGLLQRFDAWWKGRYATRSEASRAAIIKLREGDDPKPRPKQPLATEVPSQ